MRITIIILTLILSLVCFFLLLLGLFLSELLDQESTLPSGVLGINQSTLFIFLGVNVTWQIQHIISVLIFHFLGILGPLGLPLELSLSHN